MGVALGLLFGSTSQQVDLNASTKEQFIQVCTLLLVHRNVDAVVRRCSVFLECTVMSLLGTHTC